MFKINLHRPTLAFIITTFLTPMTPSPLLAMETAQTEERLIPATALTDHSLLRRKSPFFDLTADGQFLKKHDQKLTWQQIAEDGSVITGPSFDIPQVTDKVFFDAEIISPRFVHLTYGVPKDDLISDPSASENEDSLDNCYMDAESLIWDMEKSEHFKIESPDFTTFDFDVYDFNNPEKLLVKEANYKQEGDSKGKDRYRYYNLVTRQFLDLIVLDFQDKSTELVCDTDELGCYKFKYAVQHTLKPPLSQHYFVRLSQNPNGSLTIGDIVYSLSTNYLCYSNSDILENDLIIFRHPAGDGLNVPYFIDLKRKKPAERPLLTEEEMDDLKSDVYGVSIDDGFLTYTTHFEKKVTHHRPFGKIGPRGQLLQELQCLMESLEINITKLEVVHDLTYLTKNIEEIHALIEKHPDALKPYEKALAKSTLTEPFLTYLSNESKQYLHGYDLRPQQQAIIKTADERFEMPIYYITPAHVNPKGWFIVDVHGGPHSREYNKLNPYQQFWTSRGFPHLRLNIRGSTGFGANYKEASNGNWYGVIDDVKMAIDWAKEEGLGMHPIVMGGSFGGYAAAAAYTKGYADVVISLNGLFDLNKDLEHVNKGSQSHEVEELTRQFGQTSEIRAANSVTTYLTKRPGAKMLLIAGLKDDVCLPEHSNLFYQQMVDLGNHVDYVTMAEEGHTPIKSENLLMLLRVMENFLGDITGHPQEPNGYETLTTTPGVVYSHSEERVETQS